MQQTTKYKLNLIERDDVFSPDALNESTQKVESALAAEETARKNADAQLTGRADGLAQRVTALEVHKIVAGAYTGTGKTMTFNLGFTPVAVVIMMRTVGTGYHAFVTQSGHVPEYSNGNGTGTFIIEGGFRADDPLGVCCKDRQFNYIALA